MYQDSLTSEEKSPFNGKVRVILNIPPWQAAFTFEAVFITKKFIRAEWHRKDMEAQFENDDVIELFKIGKPYLIQIEDEASIVSSALVHAILTERTLGVSGLSIDLEYIEMTEELIDLLSCFLQDGSKESPSFS